ncbi:MAG: EAL domain-containing protein [Acidobacteriota bacterium]|nr:EAL domain-containing protein [Acidobacteriota bacterium]MDQ5871460.1 EAL domain-containing protein [Acidobacteriota bacterium]
MKKATRSGFLFAALSDPNGRAVKWIGVNKDVTERRRTQTALKESEQKLQTLVANMPVVLFAVDREGVFTHAEGKGLQALGLKPGEVVGRSVRETYAEHPDILEHIRRALAGETHTETVRVGEIAFETRYAPYRDDGGHVLGVIGVATDVTEQRRADKALRASELRYRTHLAFHDALTGLPNRLLLNDRLTVALAQDHRGRQKLATFYLDLDRFKVINDSLGHTVGDALLRRVADRLRSCLREGDTVARLGGNEFVILVSRIADEKDAETVARRVLAALRLPFAVEERDFFLTASIGVSLHPDDGTDAETLLQNADTAMYRAKEQGRDNYQLYAPEMSARASERLSLENRLRQALPNDELVLHYQPIVDLKSGRVRGAEALLRWRHPERGLLLPAEFITLAELSGLIAPIGRWVLQKACEQIRLWQRLGHPGLTVSVNLSPRQFQQTDLVSQVAAALEASEVEPGLLDLEITESSAMENADLTIKTLSELRRLGVGISMDDFGTGYSSLNYLKRFPIDRVKLDRSFVRDIVTNSEDAAIVRAVIALAHTLKLVVVAEGVETEDQLAFLRKHRCDEMQGFLFSSPVDPAKFQELLERRLSARSPDARGIVRPSGRVGRRFLRHLEGVEPGAVIGGMSAGLAKSQQPVEGDCPRVADVDFENCALRPGGGGPFENRLDQPAAQSTAPKGRVHVQRHDVRKIAGSRVREREATELRADLRQDGCGARQLEEAPQFPLRVRDARLETELVEAPEALEIARPPFTEDRLTAGVRVVRGRHRSRLV